MSRPTDWNCFILLLSSPRRGGLLTVLHMARRRRRSYLFSRYLLIYQLLLPHTSHSHHIPLGNCFGDILIPISSTLFLLWPPSNKCSLAHFRKKLPSNLLLILQKCSTMSANDLINFWDQTISKWPFSCHFEFCILFT